MSRADSTPAVSHGTKAATEAARAKRTLDLNPSLRPSADRRKSPIAGSGPSLRRPRVAPPREDTLPSISSARGTSALPLQTRRRRRTNEELVAARAGDHPEIYRLLLAIFQGPSQEEFHSAQDEPLYDPAQRLLIKREGQIAAHLYLSPRTMCFGDGRLSIAQVSWLGTLPELRLRGYATRLLQRAEQQMRQSGAILGVLRTRIPQFFRATGWSVCGRNSYSVGKARDILARLSAEPEARPPLSIRLFRHVELPSLMRIYSQNTSRAYGPLERIESYWRWLISRKAFEHIVVAIHGRDRMELVDTNAPIVGYAVVSQGRVVELLASPEHPTATMQLLNRTCGDTIERNRQSIAIEAPPGDRVHALIGDAGGFSCTTESDGGEVQMVKLLDPARFVKSMEEQLVARARAANLPPICELGFFIEGAKQVLTISRRGARLSAGRLGRSYLALKWNEFTRLLLGHNDLAEAVSQGRIIPSTQIALETAQALFPRLPLWRPTWDELPA